MKASSSGSPVTSSLENSTAELISASSAASVVAGISPRAAARAMTAPNTSRLARSTCSLTALASSSSRCIAMRSPRISAASWPDKLERMTAIAASRSERKLPVSGAAVTGWPPYRRTAVITSAALPVGHLR